MIASTPPMSPVGGGSSTRDLAMPRRAFQTAAATARAARQAQGLSTPRLHASTLTASTTSKGRPGSTS